MAPAIEVSRPAQVLRRARGGARRRPSRSSAARSSGCSGRTAPARRPRSRSSRATAAAAAGDVRVLGQDPAGARPAAPGADRHRAPELRLLPARDRARGGRALRQGLPGAARPGRDDRARRPRGARPTRAPRTCPAASGAGSTSRSRWSATRSCLPRRAHDRASTPPRAAPRGTSVRRAQGARQDGAADHALPRRGAGAGRPRGDRQGRARSSPRARPTSLGPGSSRYRVSYLVATAAASSTRPTTRPSCCTASRATRWPAASASRASRSRARRSRRSTSS